jgi:hypothetical protein
MFKEPLWASGVGPSAPSPSGLTDGHIFLVTEMSHNRLFIWTLEVVASAFLFPRGQHLDKTADGLGKT